MTAAWGQLQGRVVPAPLVDDPLTLTDVVRYQGASGDLNPIHHDAGFAQAAGFSGPFVVGMLPAGIAASYLDDWLGPQNVRRFKVRFREQAWPGDVLTYTAVVAAIRVEHERLVDVELTVSRQTGGIHLLGWATYAVPEDAQ